MDPLSALALKYGTDKGPNPGWHNYTPWYHELFGAIRDDVRRVLEIGVLNGCSLRMWRDYFPNATIHGLDYGCEVRPSVLLAMNEEPRLCVRVGNQTDLPTLRSYADLPLDVVIDDASHSSNDYLISFRVLWPQTTRAYIIEDVERAYWGVTEHVLAACGHIEQRISAASPDRYAIGAFR